MNITLKGLISLPTLSVAAVGLMVAMVACSGSSSTNDDKTEDEDRDSGRNNDDDEDAGKRDSGDDEEEDAGKKDADPNASCSTEKTVEACLSCCDGKAPGGRAFFNKAGKDCLCKDGSECKADCGDNYCSGKEESADCIQCQKSDDTCGTEAQAACVGNANCNAWLLCAVESECTDKEQ